MYLLYCKLELLKKKLIVAKKKKAKKKKKIGLKFAAQAPNQESKVPFRPSLSNKAYV